MTDRPPGFKDHFSGAATAYADSRPDYPAALVDALAGLTPGHALALDCGCGNGQFSHLLARRYAEVVATDASAEQIAQARPAPGVSFRVAPAEDSGLPPASVDLLTAAQAAHWFDLPRFHAEVARVVRPGGAVALVTYGNQCVDEPAVAALLEHFYTEVVGPYWPPERRWVENGYRDLPFPYPRIAVEAPPIERDWSAGQMLAYLGTWSAVTRATQARGSSPLPDLARQLGPAWGDAPRRVRWPVTVLAGRVG